MGSTSLAFGNETYESEEGGQRFNEYTNGSHRYSADHNHFERLVFGKSILLFIARMNKNFLSVLTGMYIAPFLTMFILCNSSNYSMLQPQDSPSLVECYTVLNTQ